MGVWVQAWAIVGVVCATLVIAMMVITKAAKKRWPWAFREAGVAVPSGPGLDFLLVPLWLALWAGVILLAFAVLKWAWSVVFG